MSENIKFIKKHIYNLSISYNEPIRFGRNGIVSETRPRTLSGEFECISLGKKIHFYAVWAGKDFKLTKEQAIEAYNKYLQKQHG